jgi:hypothetical protein
MDEQVRHLLSQAVEQSTLQDAGPYTNPKSWGVYEIMPCERIVNKRFRIGNHPVRKQELEREFPSVQIIAHFMSRTLAEKLSAALNAAR